MKRLVRVAICGLALAAIKGLKNEMYALPRRVDPPKQKETSK